MNSLNPFQKLGAAAGAVLVGLVVFASTAGAQTSLMPEDGATGIASTFTATVADAWPILVALIGMGILLKVVKRFT